MIHNKTTNAEVILGVEYDHLHACSMTFHTITANVRGRDADEIYLAASESPFIQCGDNGLLRHGYYVSIAFGYRNMIRILERHGVDIETIKVNDKSAKDFLVEFFPEEAV